MQTTEGAGVTVYRTIGTSALRNYDPFLLLDQISSDNPDQYIAGFPEHPHRGFITFTYLIDGDMQHQDDMGNCGNPGPGGAQWMKAASGVIHSEMPQLENGLMRGFQLWINLPAANKMDDPAYQEYTADALPIVATADATVKVLMGRYQQAVSPITDDLTEVSYFDVQLRADKRFQYDLSDGHNSFIYVFEGQAEIHGRRINKNNLLLLNPYNQLSDLVGGEQGVRFLFISGKPIKESIAQYGPFVMNTKEEINQAVLDYQANNFVRNRTWKNRNQHQETNT